MTEGPSRRLSRRDVLRLTTVSVLATVTGCRGANPGANRGANPSSTSSSAASSRTATHGAASAIPGEDPTVRAVVEKAGDAERVLVAAYDDAIAVRPELATLLAPLRADHVSHLKGLLGSAAEQASAQPSSGPPSLGAASPPPPSDVVTHLVALERSAAAARLNDMPGTSPSLSRLIASIGACEASHGAVLQAAASRLQSPSTSTAATSAP